MKRIEILHGLIDRTLVRALEKNKKTPTCGKGCFFCCKELAYATDLEIEHLLSTMTEEEKKKIHLKVMLWVAKFQVAQFEKQVKPDAHEYRKQNIWCPLLSDDKTCSVYADRPSECRLFLTDFPRSGCEDDTLRHEQKFMDFPVVVDAILKTYVCEMEDGDTIIWDHIGILLYEKLFDRTFPSAARCTLTRTGNKLIFKDGQGVEKVS